MPAESVPSARRIAAIDVARGIAVFGMFGYHLTWDLADVGFIDRLLPFSSPFRLYSHTVASAFLFLAGVSLVLAKREPYAWALWARHVGLIVGAAALVTIASAVLFPDGLIGFGILHCIAAALIVATPFLFLPSIATLLVAAGIVVLPMLWHAPAFNTAALIWTGLGTVEPNSNDYRPFFPWAAPVFAGVGLLQIAVLRRGVCRLASWRPAAGVRLLAWSGRHTLAIYLLHQPIFLGVIAAAAAITPPARENSAFQNACEQKCAVSATPTETCRSVCRCIATELSARGARDRTVDATITEDDREAVSRATQSCLRRPAP